MIYKRLVGAVAVLATAGALVLAAGSPASAQDPHYPDAGWRVQDTRIGPDVDWSDCDPGPVRTTAAQSAVVDSTTVDLVGAGDAAPPHYGTSAETPDLGLTVAAGDLVSVDYELVDGADPAGGAVRLFVYDHADADTDCTAPAAFAAAPDDGTTIGSLTVSVPFDGVLGTVGVVYDSSNGGAGGTVRFTNLVVAGTPVLFAPPPEPCPWDYGQAVAAEECAPPSPTPTASPSPTSSPSPSPAAGAGGELAATGSPVVPLLGLGVGLVLAGGGAVWLLRRRSVRFHSE